MRVVAGVDVGNSTTEVLLADASATPPSPLAWDRVPTRGRKGSTAAAESAAALVARLARRHGLAVELAVCAPQAPVATWTEADAGPAPQTGPLSVLCRSTGTPGRAGWGCGRPVRLDPSGDPARSGPSHERSEPVVLCVPAGFGFRAAVEAVRGRLVAGVRVVALLLADDEGVLVANRLPGTFPVLDDVDLDAALRAHRVAVEVSPPGGLLARLSDPIRLVAELGLPDADRPAARAVAAELADSGNAAVAVGGGRAAQPPPGVARRPAPAQDSWSLDLAAVATGVELRRDAVAGRGVVRSALVRGELRSAADVLEHRLGVPVLIAASETSAARAGALTTPGVRAGALVLDLGAGTIDVLDPGAHQVLAGAGDLMTAATAQLLAIPHSTADWVKRAPCIRLEGPHIALAEDGARTFLERPAPSGAVGSLTVPGPAGPLPFHRGLSPAEWRALRRALKRAAFSDNLARAAIEGPADVVLVGGVAGDVEILAVLAGLFPDASLGRGDIADGAGPGHRYAVAYGLTLAAGPPGLR